MSKLAHIWRHPIKGIGSEALSQADLTPEGALVGDRAWALLHEGAEDSDAWQPRRNFLVVASGPDLARISAAQHVDRISLSHPDRPALDDALAPGAMGPWIAPLWPSERPAPARLVRAPGHGMTDMPDPFVSIGSLASLRALSQRAGFDLDMRRFRMNLWIDGLAPWQEQEWIGKTLTLGDATLTVDQPVDRCRAPEASPATGQRDANVLKLLGEAGQDRAFGIYCRVQSGGTVRLGDGLDHL